MCSGPLTLRLYVYCSAATLPLWVSSLEKSHLTIIDLVIFVLCSKMYKFRNQVHVCNETLSILLP